MEWIKCSERVPEDKDHVVCINVSRGGTPFVAFRCENLWVSGSNYQPEVTHWMPLPEPPTD
ncbi:DUF551 domain-containing protein [Atlantibacter hermannii]|uniref:DUF551 domain-containing protein n=1 Tax=Atlantibacter hermannii TaxID=565 RepID=UPI0035E46797